MAIPIGRPSQVVAGLRSDTEVMTHLRRHDWNKPEGREILWLEDILMAFQ
jgi:hypothetical protein